MGYNIGIYCEPEIYNLKELQADIKKQNSFWGETIITGKNGYFLFGDYIIYEERSVIFKLCKFFNSEFYKYFNPLAYIESLDEVDEDSLTWENLQELKTTVESFIEQLKRHQKTLPIPIITSECEGISKSRFPEYYKTNLVAEVEQAKSFIELFEAYGAQKVIFGYH